MVSEEAIRLIGSTAKYPMFAMRYETTVRRNKTQELHITRG
jgi:hypothetical protein